MGSYSECYHRAGDTAYCYQRLNLNSFKAQTTSTTGQPSFARKIDAYIAHDPSKLKKSANCPSPHVQCRVPSCFNLLPARLRVGRVHRGLSNILAFEVWHPQQR